MVVSILVAITAILITQESVATTSPTVYTFNPRRTGARASCDKTR